MWTFFFIVVVHYEFLFDGPKCLQRILFKRYAWCARSCFFKQPELWAKTNWFLYHNSALCHTVLVLRDFFVTKLTHIAPQPPFSTDLTSYNFWLVSKLRRPMRGCRFDKINDLKTKIKKTILRIKNIFRKCIIDIGKKK